MTIRSVARRLRDALFSKPPEPTLPEVPPLPDARLDGALDQLEAGVDKSITVKQHARAMAGRAHVRLLASPFDGLDRIMAPPGPRR